MTLYNLKISKTFKIYCCQEHWLNLKIFMAPSMNNEKKKHPLLATTVINWFERSCSTFQKGGGKNSLSSTTLG